ncbi:ORF6C domain-containing protein [Cytobacillus horneckiae]|uniref:ORF6C domain-containing protein n=1 Tax=Cytobacillus horneckiae TaxID=549687 RepID=UPI0034CD01C0
MNQLTKMFDSQNLTIVTNGEKHEFLLRDLCNILELGQTSAVKRRLDDDVISNHPIQDSLGRTQQATFVNEDGLYDVILDSRKPEAKRFRKWITSEVLPSIRKTGKYEAPTSELQALQQTVNQLVKMDGRVSYLEDHMRIDGVQEKKLQNKGKSVAIEALGGMKTVAYKEISRKVFTAIWRDFKNHFEIPRYNELPRKQFSEAMKFLNMWQPSTSLRIEIQELNNQMSIQEVI